MKHYLFEGCKLPELIKEDEKSIEFSICDATHEFDELVARIKTPVQLVSADSGVVCTDMGGYTEIRINCSGAMGAPFRATFTK